MKITANISTLLYSTNSVRDEFMRYNFFKLQVVKINGLRWWIKYTKGKKWIK